MTDRNHGFTFVVGLMHRHVENSKCAHSGIGRLRATVVYRYSSNDLMQNLGNEGLCQWALLFLLGSLGCCYLLVKYPP
jgi:hypothetical protein